MTRSIDKSRRNFLKLSGLTAGGFMLGFNWVSNEVKAATVTSVAASAEVGFNSYLSISSDGLITFFSPNPELGQNIMTSFPMVVAEELDADWKNIKVVQSPLDTARFDRQVTGGSGAVPHSWKLLRTAGATARYMLVAAAAKRWNVDAAECTTADSFVLHAASDRKLSYGELAQEACNVPVPAEVKLD